MYKNINTYIENPLKIPLMKVNGIYKINEDCRKLLSDVEKYVKDVFPHIEINLEFSDCGNHITLKYPIFELNKFGSNIKEKRSFLYVNKSFELLIKEIKDYLKMKYRNIKFDIPENYSLYLISKNFYDVNIRNLTEKETKNYIYLPPKMKKGTVLKIFDKLNQNNSYSYYKKGICRIYILEELKNNFQINEKDKLKYFYNHHDIVVTYEP